MAGEVYCREQSTFKRKSMVWLLFLAESTKKRGKGKWEIQIFYSEKIISLSSRKNTERLICVLCIGRKTKKIVNKYEEMHKK